MAPRNEFDFVIVDCSNLAYRNWWNNRFRKTSQDVFCGLEYGFVQAVTMLARNWYPARPVLVWDGEPVRGLSLFPRVTDEISGKASGYKAERKEPEDKTNEPDWGIRLGSLRERLRSLVYTIYHKDNEADEQIAFFVQKAELFGFSSIIISNDEDLHQLVSDHTHVLRLARNSGEENVIWGEEEMSTHWGVPPRKLPLRWAIEGGGSMTGIPRIPKTVIVSMVNQCESLEDLFALIDDGKGFQTVLQMDKFRAGKENIERNYRLLNLQDLENKLTVLSGTDGDSSGIKRLCSILEMDHFVNRREWALLEEGGKRPLFSEIDAHGKAPVPASGSGDPGSSGQRRSGVDPFTSEEEDSP